MTYNPNAGFQPDLSGFQPDIQFKDEGTNQGAAGGVTAVNFVGAGVSASENAGTLTVTVAGSGVSDGDKGDITVSGSGATWTVDAGAITYAKIQAVTDARLLGRSAGSAGAAQELTVSAPVTLSGGVLDFDETAALGNNARMAVAKNSGATVGTRRRLNLIEGANITLTLADDAGNEEVDVTIAASGGGVADGDKGDITVSGSGATWTIDNDAVTYAKMQNVSATDTLLGRSTAGAGDVEEIACTAAGRALLDDVDVAAQRTTLQLGSLALQNTIDDSDIPADTVQFSKMQNITTDRLLGRDTAGTADIEQLTVSGGIEFTGTGGIQTSAFTGDVTKSAGGTATTIANDVVTYAKMQNVTDARLLGRSAGSAGDPQELTVGAPLTLSGGVLDFDESAALGNAARVAVAKNSGATVGTRRRINLVEGSNITLTIADDAGNEEVDVTIAATGGSDPWTYVKLGSDFTMNSTTPANVTGMAFAPAANSTYVIEGFFMMRSAATTTGIRPGCTWPTGLNDGAAVFTAANSATAQAIGNEGPTTEVTASATGTINTARSVPGTMWATLVTGATPSGAFQIRVRSEVASSNVTIRAGSWIRYRVI